MEKKNLNRRLLHAGLASIVLVVISIMLYMIYRGEYIQYKEIGEEYLNVFNTNVLERAGIFAVTFAFVYITVMIANFSVRKGLKKAFEEEKKVMPRLINNGAAIIFAAVAGFIAQNYFAGQILTLMNMGMFGKKDPIFGLDYSIFIIATPIIKTILKALLVYFILLAVYVTGYNIIVTNKYLDGIEFDTLGKSPLIHQLLRILVVIAGIVIVYNIISHQDILVGDMLRKESFDGIYMTGAGFIDVNIKLWAYRIVTLLIIFAVWKFIKGVKKQDSKEILTSIIIVPVALTVTFAMLVAVDYMFVRGNEIDREKEYIKENIVATEEAYNIKIEDKELEKMSGITKENLAQNKKYINSLNIVTPDVISETLKNRKEEDIVKSVYKYGHPKLFKDGEEYNYITPREIDYKKEKTLSDKIYKYTHGNFGIVTLSNKVDKNGYILNKEEGFENQEFAGIKIKEPRIYYGLQTIDSAVVNAENKSKEYDYPASSLDVKENNYQGKGGINVGIIDKLALAFRGQNTALIFRNNSNKETKILLNRQIHNRLGKIIPGLKYDKDPYLVAREDGRLAWLVDGYTITNRYPYSQKISIEADKGGKERINYIRNSVKALVDAYDGTVEFYVTDKTDPFIATIEKTYPDILKSYENLEEIVKNQIRYPKYLFDIQAKMLSTYHNIDIDTLYREDDRWEVAKVSFAGTGNEETSVYTVLKREGQDPKLGILTTYTPQKKKNIISYLFGEVVDGQGKLIMYRYPKDSNELSLSFIDAQIEKDEKIQKELKELSVLGTELKTRITILPYENTTLYIKQIYQVLLNEEPVPTLKKVIVANKGKVSIGNNLSQAILGLLTDEAINIDIRDLEDPKVLVDAIIKQNGELKNSISKKDLEYVGKDMQKLTKLIDQLEELEKTLAEKEAEETKKTEQETKQDEITPDKNTKEEKGKRR